METLSADKWCNDALREWSEALDSYTKFMQSTKAEGESSLLRSAREKRIKARLDAATTKASLATLVQQVMHDSSRGSATLEVPELQLDLRLTWAERLKSD